MISNTCSIDEFVKKVLNRDFLDIVYLAEKEATEAERKFYCQKAVAQAKRDDIWKYAQALKDLLDYLRFSVKPAKFSTDYGLLFICLSNSLKKPLR